MFTFIADEKILITHLDCLVYDKRKKELVSRRVEISEPAWVPLEIFQSGSAAVNHYITHDLWVLGDWGSDGFPADRRIGG